MPRSTNILKFHKLVREHCKNYGHYDFENIMYVSDMVANYLKSYVLNKYSCTHPIYISCSRCVFRCSNGFCLMSGVSHINTKEIADILLSIFDSMGKLNAWK